MKIVEKIDTFSEEMMKNPALSRQVAKHALEAIFSGMRTATGEVTPQWEKLMSHFTKDQKELDRLCGKDEDFNNSEWGLFCLAYVAGDSTCTSNTTVRGGPMRSIRMHDDIAKNRALEQNLDAEIPDQSGILPEGTANLENFMVNRRID